MKWDEYKPYVTIARKIVRAVNGRPSTGASIAEEYNIVGKVARLIIDEGFKSKSKNHKL